MELMCAPSLPPRSFSITPPSPPPPRVHPIPSLVTDNLPCISHRQLLEGCIARNAELRAAGSRSRSTPKGSRPAVDVNALADATAEIPRCRLRRREPKPALPLARPTGDRSGGTCFLAPGRPGSTALHAQGCLGRPQLAIIARRAADEDEFMEDDPVAAPPPPAPPPAATHASGAYARDLGGAVFSLRELSMTVVSIKRGVLIRLFSALRVPTCSRIRGHGRALLDPSSTFRVALEKLEWVLVG